MIEPVSAGNSQKRNEDKFRDEISQIEASRERLLQVRKEILAGTISARGYKEAIQDGRSGAKFTVSESDQSLLQELQKVMRTSFKFLVLMEGQELLLYHL